MSYETDKGYRGERTVRDYYLSSGLACVRPRTTSRTDTDAGDITGPPWVTSVKNHRRMALAGWVDELHDMVRRAQLDTGIVVHHRVGRGRPDDWYVTTTLGLAVPLLRTYALCNGHI